MPPLLAGILIVVQTNKRSPKLLHADLSQVGLLVEHMFDRLTRL